MPDVPTFTNGGLVVLILLAVVAVFVGGAALDEWVLLRRLADPTPMFGEPCPACLGSGDSRPGAPWTNCGTCDGIDALDDTTTKETVK